MQAFIDVMERGIIITGLIVGLTGLAVSAAICWGLLKRWPLMWRGWDRGDLFRKAQAQPILRLGGVGIALAASISVVLAWFLAGETFKAAAGPFDLLFIVLLFFGLGLFDDLSPIPAVIKFGLQLLIACLAFYLGIRIELLSNPFGEGSLRLQGFSFLVTIAWIVAIPNLINLVDGIDGVAGAAGIALLLTLAVVSGVAGDSFLMLSCLGVAGGVIGFLRFNLPKAKMYLGDSGTYLVGAFIAVNSVAASQKGAIGGALLVIVVALALPIADTAFAVLRRAFYGFPIWRADSEHIHHRLVTLGVRKGFVIGGMIGAVVVFALLGLSLFLNEGQTWPTVLTIAVVGLVVLFRMLGYWRSPEAFRDHVRRILMTREKVRYAYALGTVLEHEIDRAPSPEVFWEEFRHALSKVGLIPDPNFCGTLFPQGCDREEDLACFEVPLANGGIWHLCHRRASRSMHWGKIAACFMGPLSRGVHKWGSAPADLGVVIISEKEANVEIQETLALDNP